MYSAGQFSKNASEASKRRKESIASQKERLQVSSAGGARQQGNASSGGGSSARKAAQQNRAKHRAEFEMQMGMAPHPIRPAKGTSGSSISQQQPQQSSNRRRRNRSGRGVAYICLGLLGGFFLVTGTLLMAFGFTSDGFSWTSVTIGMILAYCGICIAFIGFLFLFIFIVMCCTDRRRRRDDRALEKAEYYERERTDKQNDTRSEQYCKPTGNRQNGKHETSDAEQKNR